PFQRGVDEGSIEDFEPDRRTLRDMIAIDEIIRPLWERAKTLTMRSGSRFLRGWMNTLASRLESSVPVVLSAHRKDLVRNVELLHSRYWLARCGGNKSRAAREGGIARQALIDDSKVLVQLMDSMPSAFDLAVTDAGAST